MRLSNPQLNSNKRIDLWWVFRNRTFRRAVSAFIALYLALNNLPRAVNDGINTNATGGSGVAVGRKFTVWMYPFPPPSLDIDGHFPPEMDGDAVLICAYEKACNGKGTSINMATLTKDTFYHPFILDHPYHKLRHMTDFCHHIQVIALLALLLKNPGACVQTLGDTNFYCSANPFRSYNPYISVGDSWSFSFEVMGEGLMELTHFPYELISRGSNWLSLAPDMGQEEFATYGPYNISHDARIGGRYNSGEDIQSMAGVGWYPFLSSVREKVNPLLNYSGHYIANSLSSPPMKMHCCNRSLMEKVDIVSMYFPGDEMITQNNDYLQKYTNEVFPFGCRSTKTCAVLHQHKIPAYFSSCLTLTSTYQGSVLYSDGSNPSLNGLPFLDPSSANYSHAVNEAKRKKDLILLVDVVDTGVLPQPLPSNHRWLSADISPSYPRSCMSYSERIDYCYRLLSQYANHAKVVITSRIHVGLPASALGVPVIFVSKGGWLPGGHERVGRVAGLLDIFHRVDATKGLNWTIDLTGPIPPNPGNHEADRRRAAFWHRLKRIHYYRDAAKMFGRVPLQRIGAGTIDNNIHHNFHFLMNQADLHDWRSRRSVEVVLYFHPNAKISIHIADNYNFDNNSKQSEFELFVESGYDVSIQMNSQLHKASVDHVKKMLHESGGVFVSKGTFIRESLPIALQEGYSLNEHGDVALMIGKKGSKAIKPSNEWSATYLTSAETKRCMEDPTWEIKSTEDVAVTIDQATLGEYDIKFESKCYDLIEKNVIYNDELHWKY